MTYTKQEKQKLDRVISVFAERLKESDAFDLVWSDKVGYVLLDSSARAARRPSYFPWVQQDFPEWCPTLNRRQFLPLLRR